MENKIKELKRKTINMAVEILQLDYSKMEDELIDPNRTTTDSEEEIKLDKMNLINSQVAKITIAKAVEIIFNLEVKIDTETVITTVNGLLMSEIAKRRSM